jgi:glycosyltransferase involved in cell wall biosynthesis
LKLAVVVPCYNEQEVLKETSTRMLALLGDLIGKNKISRESKIVFIDDGSSDNTWSIIQELCDSSLTVAGIRLSRNHGHQNALLAGLFTVQGDALVSIDADLQDDIQVIEEMVDAYKQGIDVVYGVRKSRESDSFFKRFTAQSFYRVISFLGAEAIYNHADYRLMSRRAIEALKQFEEVNLFLRGMVPLIGFNSKIVYYDRNDRFAGESKYPLKRMVGLALDAITSFSVVPLRIITLIGFLTFLCTSGIGAWVFWVKYFTDTAVPGWASTVLPIYFIGGIQILCLGVLGEYMGKIYSEVKRRPRYIISDVINP